MTIDEKKIRDSARPHGVVSLACRNCFFFRPCGGIEPERALFDCFDHYCCGGKSGCDEVCPYNGDFVHRMREVGGLQFGDVSRLTQRTIDLPQYVPLIHHGYSHRMPLAVPVVALDTYQVFRFRNGSYRAVADDGPSLRKAFGLSPDTRIVLRGTARDRRLEQYWTHRKRNGVPQQIGRLGIDMLVAPNFSHFLDVPRTDNLFNRKRQLICITELSQNGVCVVPHLSAVTPGDWKFWESYVQNNDSVKYLAVEFQTGNKNPVEGKQVIQQVARIQTAVGRPLHPLVIGGTQFVRKIAKSFSAFTVIDSSPFIKAVKRRRHDGKAAKTPWNETFTLMGQGIESILLDNLKGHAKWIEDQCMAGANRNGVPVAAALETTARDPGCITEDNSCTSAI
jgi:hypothetical protein